MYSFVLANQTSARGSLEVRSRIASSVVWKRIITAVLHCVAIKYRSDLLFFHWISVLKPFDRCRRCHPNPRWSEEAHWTAGLHNCCSSISKESQRIYAAHGWTAQDSCGRDAWPKICHVLPYQQVASWEFIRSQVSQVHQKSQVSYIPLVSWPSVVEWVRMHHLQRSFPTESECEGLRVELNASKKRQHSLEQQQVQSAWLMCYDVLIFCDSRHEKRRKNHWVV